MTTTRTRTAGAALIAAALTVSGLAAGAGPAAAEDLETLRSRAQALGEQVSALEVDLADLNEDKGALEDEIAVASADIGALELEVSDAEDAYRSALDRYVERAVEAYKSGPSGELSLLLSAHTLDDLYTALEVNARSADRDGDLLRDLLVAREDAEAAQARVDERKQLLLAQHAKIDAVTTEIETKIGTRRAVLKELTNEIDRLEHRARLAAARAARPGAALLDLLRPSGPSPGVPPGFAGTGVTFSGIASWYGPGFEGNPTANGDIFDPSLYTAASKELPFGTWLFVVYEGRGVVVLVNDRGPYIDGRILDLSEAAADVIGLKSSGIGWIEAEILIKTRR